MARSGSAGGKIGGFDVSNDINNEGKTIRLSYSELFSNLQEFSMRAEDVLADQQNQAQFNGVTVRKGTVGAFLANARLWLDDTSSSDDKAIAERDIVDALPALHALGLFDIVQVRDAALRELVAVATE